MRVDGIADWIRAYRGWLVLACVLICIVTVFLGVRRMLNPGGQIDPERNRDFARWWTGNEAEREALITRQETACSGAPFILPGYGYIGLLYGDPRGPYSQERPHQGIDIFTPEGPGITPVYAAYAGYLTREPHWVSSVIVRVPDDPLSPGRQIWLYYTHMADNTTGEVFIVDDFPAGTREKYVEQGSLLGYMGNYSGRPQGVGVHLHFSIVLDNGLGGYRNELEFNNTVDPSRYLGMSVNIGCADRVPQCSPDPGCPAAVGRGG